MLCSEHIYNAGNIVKPFHKKVLLSNAVILGLSKSTFATDLRLIKFSVFCSSTSKSYFSISNAFLNINKINIKPIGNNISHNVVPLFLFNTNIFFFIKAFNFDDEPL